MNVHISYKGLEKTPDVESTVKLHLKKLERRLQVFRPELVSLHGSVLQKSPRAGFVVALNLKLPTTDIAAEQANPNSAVAVKAAFDSLIGQISRHKGALRNEHAWPRRQQEHGRNAISEVPFEDTVAAIKPESVTNEDVSSYINANLPRLRRFVQRELRHREQDEKIARGSISVDEVIDEAIGNALSEAFERPEKMRLEPWLYRLSTDAIDRLAAGDSGGGNIPLDRPDRSRDGEGSDENVLQFHQPDEDLSAMSLTFDKNISTPEDLAAKDEMISLVERTLRDAGRNEREAFILFTIEGFTVEEIADITQKPEEEVRKSVHSAREYLKEFLPVRDPLSDRLIEHSKTA
ncbi:sigma-24, ECF subfamily [Candidatus Koribacter versatilis Ellin345]|uniref:Sigma-24, ECF subfamily n=1 Tax=Koribacter versatilis (strain Ellin345) TaxID=204669 RepID=Q1IU45_KORVE|nr:HPF/RaiA family ribosome-associated protein [Candidatus Koribacter versatilis]ABF39605.1 sigma-24, ECF subfamily [Candidatus Koribacter versatilis Ellin345]